MTSVKKSGAVAVHSVKSVHRDISNLKGVLNSSLGIYVLTNLELRPKSVGTCQVATRVESELDRVAVSEISNNRGIVVSREGDCSDSIKAVGIDVGSHAAGVGANEGADILVGQTDRSIGCRESLRKKRNIKPYLNLRSHVRGDYILSHHLE